MHAKRRKGSLHADLLKENIHHAEVQLHLRRSTIYTLVLRVTTRQ